MFRPVDKRNLAGRGRRILRFDVIQRAFAASHYAAKAADHADERAASGAGISFGGALFVSAGPAAHRFLVVKIRHG